MSNQERLSWDLVTSLFPEHREWVVQSHVTPQARVYMRGYIRGLTGQTCGAGHRTVECAQHKDAWDQGVQDGEADKALDT